MPEQCYVPSIHTTNHRKKLEIYLQKAMEYFNKPGTAQVGAISKAQK